MLKHLSIGEMGELMRPWVARASRRALFLSIPEIAGLHPKVVRLYGDLRAVRRPVGGMSPALQAIVDEAMAVDDWHDALARAVHAGVAADRALALAHKPAATDRASEGARVLSELFPGGLSIVNASLLAESAETARVARLLDDEPAIATYLEAIPVRGEGTLLHVTRRWIAAGKKLAKLEDEREELQAAEATLPVSREAVNRLRARWIRLVAQVLSLLEMSDADPTAIATIRRPILRASARAAKRYGATDEGEAEGEALLDDDGLDGLDDDGLDDDGLDDDVEPEALAAVRASG